MGEAPGWYFLIKEAAYLGVPPWELLDQPIHWRNWARMANKAESEAKKQRDASRKRKGLGQ